MLGNKYIADEIAKNFQQIISKSQLKKKASFEPKPEDFLVSEEKPVDVHSQALDNKIDEVSSYAKDKSPCEKCNKVHEGDCKIESKENEAEDDSKEDVSYLVDKQAQHVLFELGKIAGNLRKKGKGLAADVVEATALEIKENTIKEAAKKLEIVSNLNKMASDAYKSGDRMTGDVITVTIDKIKRSK